MARPKGSTGRRQLTTGEKTRIRTLYLDALLPPSKISSITGFTSHQVRRAIRSKDTIARRSSGRPCTLTSSEEMELISLLTASRAARQMSFADLSLTLWGGKYSIWCIKNAVYRLGFRRRKRVLQLHNTLPHQPIS